MILLYFLNTHSSQSEGLFLPPNSRLWSLWNTTSPRWLSDNLSTRTSVAGERKLYIKVAVREKIVENRFWMCEQHTGVVKTTAACLFLHRELLRAADVTKYTASPVITSPPIRLALARIYLPAQWQAVFSDDVCEWYSYTETISIIKLQSNCYSFIIDRYLFLDLL